MSNVYKIEDIKENNTLEKYLSKIRYVSKKGNVGRRKRPRFRDVIMTFDIETTTIDYLDDKHAFMYIWQFGIDGFGVIYGRYWNDFVWLVQELESLNSAGDFWVVYIHNLSFEMQFLSAVLKDFIDECFILKNRHFAKVTTSKIEFRCSYVLTGRSLSNFTDLYSVVHGKLSGDEYDYGKIRTPKTELSDSEMLYCINDVLGLIEALKCHMDFYGDNLASIPLTKTGYIRRICRKAMRGVNIREALPDYEIYTLLKDAFRGGNTHANRYFSCRKVNSVVSIDIASSYPFQILSKKFPYKFEKCTKTMEYYISVGYAVIANVTLYNLELKNLYETVPYIAKGKCMSCRHACIDNGRIISADELTLSITDIDYEIISKMYSFDITVNNAYYAPYKDLPQNLKDVVMQQFRDKTYKKGEAVEYALSKELLNSIYGMMVQAIDINDIFYDVDTGEFSLMSSSENSFKNNINKSFILYQWGVWITAYARKQLQDMIDLIGDDFIYCDTDSVKFLKNENYKLHEDDIKSYNSEIEKLNISAKDKKEKIHLMGVYEHDATYNEFITFGAKKYAYMSDGKLGVTISGVLKKIAPIELENDIDNLKLGYVFKEAGGTEARYHDNLDYGYADVGDEKIHITRNVAIVPSTYTLSITEEYANIIGIENIDFSISIW